MTQDTGRPKRNNFLPYVLIVVGAVILIGNLGPGLGAVLRAAAAVVSLWPIALIAVGVDLLTAGKYRAIVVGAAVVVALVLLFAPARFGGTMTGAGVAQDVRVALGGATNAEVSLDLGVADLTLGSSPLVGELISGVVTPSRGERFELETSRRGSTLDAELKSVRDRGSFNFGLPAAVDGGSWDLVLSQSVPIDLDIDAGVGQSNLDLRNVRLTGFEIDAGVGGIEATLPGGDYQGSIEGGVGSITVRLPQGTAARIVVDTGLGGVSADANFQRDGDVFTTANYTGSGVRLAISAGVGHVRIETVR